MSRFLLSFSFLLLLCSPSLAGQLFPPDNSATPGACVDGKVLKWTGDSVTCVDPLNKATITCPAGQVMKGVVNGGPDCVTESASSTPLTLSCPAGQVLKGISSGAPQCQDISFPTGSWCGVGGHGPAHIPCLGNLVGAWGIVCPAGYTKIQFAVEDTMYHDTWKAFSCVKN